MFMMTSMASGSCKDDCKPLKSEFHAGSSEAHGMQQRPHRAYLLPSKSAFTRYFASSVVGLVSVWDGRFCLGRDIFAHLRLRWRKNHRSGLNSRAVASIEYHAAIRRNTRCKLVFEQQECAPGRSFLLYSLLYATLRQSVQASFHYIYV